MDQFLNQFYQVLPFITLLKSAVTMIGSILGMYFGVISCYNMSNDIAVGAGKCDWYYYTCNQVMVLYLITISMSSFAIYHPWSDVWIDGGWNVLKLW